MINFHDAFGEYFRVCSFRCRFLSNKLFNWNRRATVGLVLDAAAADVVVVAAAMVVVFALLADGDNVPAVDGFTVDIVVYVLCVVVSLACSLARLLILIIQCDFRLFRGVLIFFGGFKHTYM